MSQNRTLAEETLEMIQAQTAALEKAAQFYQEKEAETQLVEAKIPQVVELLVSQGKIEPEEREKCASALRDPATALELFKNALLHRSDSSAQIPGQIVDRDGNVANVKNAFVTGYRNNSHSAATAAADRILFG